MTAEERHLRRIEARRRYRERNRARINEQERIRKLARRAQRKNWHSSSPEKRKEYYLRYRSKARTEVVEFEQRLQMKFGIGVSEYDAILAKQGYGCAICRSPHGGIHKRSPDPAKRPIQRLAVDHDHGTGLVRGLLCRKCNTALGLFDDDPRLLAQAIGYLGGKNAPADAVRRSP